MCGRYLLYNDNSQNAIMKILNKAERRAHVTLNLREIVPSMNAPVMLPSPSGNNYQVDLLRFGYTVNQKPIINARSESIVDKPLFRDDFLFRRCLIPCTAFYEYAPEKTPYLFSDNHSILLLGGIYRPSKQANSPGEFVILTKAPDRTVSQIHNRMPVIIAKEKMYAWLYDINSAFQLLQDYTQNLSFIAT